MVEEDWWVRNQTLIPETSVCFLCETKSQVVLLLEPNQIVSQLHWSHTRTKTTLKGTQGVRKQYNHLQLLRHQTSKSKTQPPLAVMKLSPPWFFFVTQQKPLPYFI